MANVKYLINQWKEEKGFLELGGGADDATTQNNSFILSITPPIKLSFGSFIKLLKTANPPDHSRTTLSTTLWHELNE